MTQSATKKPEYGNWVSSRLVYVPGAAALVFAGLSLLLPWLATLAVFFFLCFAYFGYARYRFSPRGGNLQAKLQTLLLDNFAWDGEGKVIDIGCGDGALTIMVAKEYRNAQVTGVDYWGAAWEYSLDTCERNAEIEGVGDRVVFHKASASSLPFEDGYFDAAVSNVTFHEVRDVKYKRLLIREALRVVRKGGSFGFQDLFLWKRVYGEADDLLQTIKSWGIDKVELVDTSRSPFIPRALKLPFMVGTIAILHGRK
jgi:SAM-dependent methyltransferase